jgi:hypothetical protein
VTNAWSDSHIHYTVYTNNKQLRMVDILDAVIPLGRHRTFGVRMRARVVCNRSSRTSNACWPDTYRIRKPPGTRCSVQACPKRLLASPKCGAGGVQFDADVVRRVAALTYRPVIVWHCGPGQTVVDFHKFQYALYHRTF